MGRYLKNKKKLPIEKLILDKIKLPFNKFIKEYKNNTIVQIIKTVCSELNPLSKIL
tara:strand:+ start:336 stop:503 length:168 start_codon:yes stop_codon:yes gene_type:complete